MGGFTSTTGKMFEVPPTKNPLWGPVGLVCQHSAHFPGVAAPAAPAVQLSTEVGAD